MSVIDDSRPSETIAQFCAIEGISRSTYHKMRRDGFGPDETRVLNSKIIRISAAAHDAWRQRMAGRNAAQRRELETRRRQASAAARRSVLSPNHVRHRQRRGKGGRADAR